MDVSNDLIYSIVYDNPNYEKSIKSLNNSEMEDLFKKIEILKTDPYDIAKPLRKPHLGKYSVRIFGKRYRLIITINEFSKKVKLIHVHPHILAYAS